MPNVSPDLANVKKIMENIINAIFEVDEVSSQDRFLLQHHKHQCCYLLQRCSHLFVEMNKVCLAGEDDEQERKTVVKQLEATLEMIRNMMYRLSTIPPLSCYLQRRESADIIHDSHKSLDDFFRRVKKTAPSELLFNAHQHDVAYQRDEDQFTKTLAELSMNVDDIEEAQDHVLDVVYGLQDESSKFFGNPQQRQYIAIILKKLRKRHIDACLEAKPGVISSCQVSVIERKPLGEGGFGSVFSGRWNRARVAVKTLKKGIPFQALAEELSREFEIWRDLEHDHIAFFLGACIESNQPFIVSVLYQFGDVVKYLDKFPNTDRIRLSHEISLGMTFLHDRKIIHGDLKPSNILVDDGHHARVADFGLSKAKHSLTTSVTTAVSGDKLHGSRPFMAPELFSEQKIGYASDVYAFAVSVYQMMTGIVPFQQFDLVMHFELVVRKRMRPAKPAENHPSIANGLNEDMWKLLEMCWASDRKERPSFKEINKVLRSLEKKAAPGEPLRVLDSEHIGLRTYAEARQETENDACEDPSKGVLLPFSHIASISKNWEFYGQADVLDKIDYAFGLKRHSGTHEAQLHNHDDGSCIPKSYVLSGLGGIGKTEIAIEYLYSRRSRFDAIFWIYADTTRKLGTQFVTLAKELGKLSANDGMDEMSARKVVKAWLADPVGYHNKNGKFDKVTATWLMVFDNADDPDILYDWLPVQGPGCVLVTGRYPYLKEKYYLLRNGLDLEALSPEIGGDMLRELSDRQQEADAVDTSTRIVKLLGGLPLAISQMSAIIRRKHLTLRDFEDWYHEDSKSLHNLRVNIMQSNYQHTVGTTWAVEQLSTPAFALLKVLSVLDPDRIPEELLTDGVKEVEMQDYPTKKDEYFNARAELIHASFVTKNMAANELRVHRLVQDVVRQRMKESELRTVYAAVALLLSAVWPYVCGTDPTRNQFWRIPIAEKYTAHVCGLNTLFGADILEGKYDGTATIGYVFCSYAWYISERGLPDQTEIFASLAQRILRKALDAGGGDEEQITHWLGEAHHNLSLAAVLTGSSDGMCDAKLWLDILLNRTQFRRRSVAEALSLATAYNQMGICYIKNDEVEDAMDSWKQSLAAYRSVDNPPNFSGTFPAISLAQLYVLQGRPSEAEEVLTPTLEEHERILGKDDKTTTESGHIWRAMGNIRNAQQRYGEALKYHERAVENMKATLGEKHYFTGDCFYSLGVDWMRQGDATKARENLDAAIEAFTDATHREAQAARAIWKKSCLLKIVGDRLESERLCEKAMKIRCELVPDDIRQAEELHERDWTDLIFFWSC